MEQVIKVLHLSTHNEECGIATFQQNITDAMGAERAIENVFFDISPNKLKLMKGKEFDAALHKFSQELKRYDILHIQHEYSFYNDDQLQRIVSIAKSKHKKILFTLHTPPHALGKNMPVRTVPGLHPRSWIQTLRTSRALERFRASHIKPLLLADLLIVPSQAAKESFEQFGVLASKFQVVELPVPNTNTGVKTDKIAQALHKEEGDVILSTVGFLSATKGITAAIKALTYLPDHYKLALIGGAHPSGQNDKFYDKTCDLIRELNLKDRVYITGYVGNDDERDAMLRETDICLYPYDRDYYNYVSSAALTNAIANELPIVAYKTDTFLEANNEVPFINNRIG